MEYYSGYVYGLNGGKSTGKRCVGFIDWELGHSLAVFVESGSRLGAFGSSRRIEEPLCSP